MSETSNISVRDGNLARPKPGHHAKVRERLKTPTALTCAEARERLQTSVETFGTSERRSERYNILAGPSRHAVHLAGRQKSNEHSLEKGQGERGRNLKTLIS